MELWIVLDNLLNEPEVFSNREDAVSFVLENLQDYQIRWHFEQEDYENSCAMIKSGNDDSEYWGTYLGGYEINIFKKFI